MPDFVYKEYYSIDDLQQIMKDLRGENGCPWDREQSHKSIRNNFIEEVYEAIEAIDTDDTKLMREELGDVLLQIIFHCELEAEKETFDFNDVVDELCQKLIIRHPHVFGSVTVNNTEEVLNNWENIKNEVKGTESYTQTLKNVPNVLPALMRAEKIGKRASKAGMDFKDIKSTLAILKAEIEELEESILKGDANDIADEMGDVLFSCTNVARKLSINSEETLSKSCKKFIARFEKVENLTKLDGKDMKSLSIDELDVYWDRAKKIV